MKRNIIFYVCAAALVFASCQKEEPVSEGTELAPSGLDVITATTVSTKTTTQDGVNVLWENGDQIGLFIGGSDNRTKSAIYTATMAEPNASAIFVRTEDPAPGSYENEYFALYPASSLNKWASSMEKPATRRVYVNLPQSQTAVAGAWDKKAGILASSSSSSEFQFKHIMAYVKFTVDASSTPFVSMTVKSNNSESLTGENIGVLYGGQVAYDPVYTSGTYYPTAELVNEDGSEFGAGTYYVAVLPGTFAKGLSFFFKNKDGEVTVKEITGEVQLGAGQVANMGTIGTLNFGAATSDKVGTVYAEGGVNQGVVFWVDSKDSTKGKIISGAAVSLKWGDGTDKTYTWAENIKNDDGAANHEYVIGLEGSSATEYPAVYFCENLGEGWHLPTISEVEQLIVAYYGILGPYDTVTTYYSTEPYASNAAKFEAELAKCFVGDSNLNLATTSASWYWTGQSYYKDGDANSGKICRIRISPSVLVSGANATNACNVRCVREVELQ